MKFAFGALVLAAASSAGTGLWSVSAFTVNHGVSTSSSSYSHSHPSSLGPLHAEAVEASAAASPPAFTNAADAVKHYYPGALPTAAFAKQLKSALESRGYDVSKTLLATSLCCDEINREMENELNAEFGAANQFVMGGLAGTPFGGITSFGAMASHIPDGGDCCVVYGPHVGVSSTGIVGKVERRGQSSPGGSCGSAQAAYAYVDGVRTGKATKRGPPTADELTDASQIFVGNSLLPAADRLAAASDPMVELPKALYDIQDKMMCKIVKAGAKGVGGYSKDGTVVQVGGIQINTPAGASEYFLPLRAQIVDQKGRLVEDIIDAAFPASPKVAGSDVVKAKIQAAYPGALPIHEFVTKSKAVMAANGFDPANTLVATSLCCDEVNRELEAAIQDQFGFGTTFSMGGLAGTPFGGITSFGAFCSHIPDDGSAAVFYGPHVGVDSTGAVGKVDRRGRDGSGSCCGSAVAAAGYVASVANGDAAKAAAPTAPTDAQQTFVGNMLLPHAKRLDDAADAMEELPRALYDVQDAMMKRIIDAAGDKVGAASAKGQLALIGGIQINTPPSDPEYFLPLTFEIRDADGKLVSTQKL